MRSFVFLALLMSGPAFGQCPAGVMPLANQPLSIVATEHAPGDCHFRSTESGIPLPDPACTPGAVNPTVTTAVMRSGQFRTSCVRNHLTSEAAKHIVYSWYGVTVPPGNVGRNQRCELDHLIDLYDGGSDGIENIWPQCDFRDVPLKQRYFKIKDQMELDSGNEIRAGKDPLAIQSQMAEDWTAVLGETQWLNSPLSR